MFAETTRSFQQAASGARDALCAAGLGPQMMPVGDHVFGDGNLERSLSTFGIGPFLTEHPLDHASPVSPRGSLNSSPATGYASSQSGDTNVDSFLAAR